MYNEFMTLWLYYIHHEGIQQIIFEYGKKKKHFFKTKQNIMQISLCNHW